MVKIIDSFIFYNEIDLLVYRLHYLNSVVDYFILVESKYTFMGCEKELYFDKIKYHPIFSPFLNKIIHIILPNMPFLHPQIGEQWYNEYFQRNQIQCGIIQVSLNDNDYIIISDVDEIPDKNRLEELRKNDTYEKMELEQDFYYYNLRTKYSEKWKRSKIVKYKCYKEYENIQDIRNDTMSIVIEKGGWHLSYFGNVEYIQNKIIHFSHQELNQPLFRNEKWIMERVKNQEDLFGIAYKPFLKINISENDYLPPEKEIFLTKYL